MQVAQHLGIELQEADFTAEYWRDVFTDLVSFHDHILTVGARLLRPWSLCVAECDGHHLQNQCCA